MGRPSLGAVVLVAFVLLLASVAAAQTRDETLIYALASDVDNWDPPNSVQRHVIILGDLIHAGRATLDPKKRAETYARAQRILFDDAAYLFTWGLRGVWGLSNRIEYEAPRDEIDRMYTVTRRKP